MSRRKLIAANWKMQKTIAGAGRSPRRLKSRLAGLPAVRSGRVPAVFRGSRHGGDRSKAPVAVGAQDLFWENDGAYTGEVSGEMVVEAGGTLRHRRATPSGGT